VSITRFASLLSVFLLLGWSQQAIAFDCPQIERSGPGVLRQTKQDQQALSKVFAGGDIESKIGVAVADLQREHPNLGDAELLNYLIGAYCPAVAATPGLTDTQKTARVQHFAATVFELLSEQKL
jgi:hypothetical protein